MYLKGISNRYVVEVQILQICVQIMQFFEYTVILSLHVQDPVMKVTNIHVVWTDLSKGRKYYSELLLPCFLSIDSLGRVGKKLNADISLPSLPKMAKLK